MSAKARRKVGNFKIFLNTGSEKNIFRMLFHIYMKIFHIYMYINPKIQFAVPQNKLFLLILVIYHLIISAYSS